jgi:hypothetical protein
MIWNIAPYTLAEWAAHPVPYGDITRWIRHEGEEPDRVVRKVQTTLSDTVHEELYVRNRMCIGMLCFVRCDIILVREDG